MAVVHLDDLDVVGIVQGLGDLFGDHHEDVDAEAHIGGDQHRDVARRPLQAFHMAAIEAGGADDDRRAGLGREFGMLDGGGGRGEVDHRIDPGDHRGGVPGDGDSCLAEPDQKAGIPAQRFASRPFRRAGQRAALALDHLAQQHPAHAPGRADDTDLHVIRHG